MILNTIKIKSYNMETLHKFNSEKPGLRPEAYKIKNINDNNSRKHVSYYKSYCYYKCLLDVPKVWGRIHLLNHGEECFGLQELQMQRLIMTLACFKINKRERRARAEFKRHKVWGNEIFEIGRDQMLWDLMDHHHFFFSSSKHNGVPLENFK